MGSRYYEPRPTDEIKPGKISAELREALNIPENDLPIWIYRMRALGYPPGWLKKAIVDTSDIFDTDESRKRKTPSPTEIQYDHSKLIEYPGFNSPLPPGCHDYHYYVNMPGMLAHQQLDYAKKHMNAFKPTPAPKKVKHDIDNAEPVNSTTDIKPVIKVEKDEPVVNVKKEPANESCDKKVIIKKESPDHSQDTSLIEVSPTRANESNTDMNESDKDRDDTTTANQSSASISNNSLTDEVKLVSKGSPMPKPISRLPLERFSEGVVGELLYFENLPNTGGKFDNLRGLLNSMRKGSNSSDEPKSITKSSTQ